MMRRAVAPFFAAWALLLAGCPSTSTDPPPPPRKPEIPSAPPHALGALAGGTDAAPKPDVTLPMDDGSEGTAPPPAVPDAGTPDGAAPEGSAPEEPGPPPHTGTPPDAGIAL
jgi:hypothetical protein